MTRIAGQVTIQLNIAEAKLGGKRYARAVVSELAKAVQKQAQENVAPGKGPGPHPHKVWPGFPPNIDTGDLMRSVKTALVEDTETRAEVGVYSDLEYGKDLEIGWTQPETGNFWRYPWLFPATEAARQQFGNVAKRLYRVLAGKLAR